MYSREFQAMLDSLVEEDSLLNESFHNVAEKKRRLTMDQVKSLEKNFEVENKLEPERKAKIAKELGLQPRQVAIWFQNRRARLKTKQLEKDYGVLKANYDALKLDFTNIEQERQVLIAKLRDLRSKLKEENAESCIHSKQNRPMQSEQSKDQENTQTRVTSSSSSSWVEPYRLEPEIVKIEEQNNIFAAEETCDFFSIDHAPTLQWWFNGV